jgi:nicotinate phosphoribosyltransferase
MSYAYWKMGLKDKEAVFLLSFRKSPFKGGFTIAAGLESVISFLENFHFDASDLSYLESLHDDEGLPYFPPQFLDYLSKLKFTGNIDAVPEGTAVFPQEPLIRIQGPLIECQLLESPLLNLINFPTLIATKAARVCLAAQGDPVLEFGLRRAQGMDGALTASRAAYIGGCDSTSNMMAGKLFDIPVKGTHSHSWIMVFDEELEAFQAYAEAYPGNCLFLVDTYNTIEGVKNAIKVGKNLREKGKKLLGIRLDSGDLADLSIKSRKLLDQAGFHDAIILASNELDETIISELKRQGAKISAWGVGTSLVTAKQQPALDGVYKLSAIRDPGGDWKYKLKLSEQIIKISNPGLLQVRRFYSKKENVADLIYDSKHALSDECCLVDFLDPTNEQILSKDLSSKDLLVPIFRHGKCIYNLPSLKSIREYTKKELDHFSIGIKRFLNPHLYIVGMEKSLYQFKVDLIKGLRHRYHSNMNHQNE